MYFARGSSLWSFGGWWMQDDEVISRGVPPAISRGHVIN